MKKQVVFGVILGLLVSGTMAMAQTQPADQKPAKKIKKTSVSKKSAIKSKTSLKQSNKPALTKTNLTPLSKSVAGAPANRAFNPKSLYAQNTVGTPAAATDSSSGPTSHGAASMMVSPPVLTPPGQTTATVTSPTSEEKKNPFTFKYVSINSENINSIEAPNASGSSYDREVQAWDRFYFNYNINNDISAYVMPQLFHTWFGDPGRPQDSNNPTLNQQYSGYIGDTGLFVKDAKIAMVGGGIKLDGFLGWFLPTSQASQQSDQIGEFSGGFEFSRSYGILDLKWTENPRYFFQGYQTSTLVDGSGLPLRNEQYEIWSLLESNLNITKKFGFDLTAGFMNRALYADNNNLRPAVYNDYIILDPELDYEFSSHFSLGLGLWEEYDMRNASEIGTNPANPATGAPATPIYVNQYTPFAAWNGGTQVYLVGTIKL